MSDKAHAKPLKDATADFTELVGIWQLMQAAVIRGNTDDADALRARAHLVLDSYLDNGVQAALAVKLLHDC